MVLTGRGGMVRTPIMYPYLESIDAILIMITRYNAKVVEVLDDGREVELTINNFNIDNSKETVVQVDSIPVRREVEPVNVPVTAPFNKNMSRKERKRLEHERKMAESAAQEQHETETPVVDNGSKSDEVDVKEEVSSNESVTETEIKDGESQPVEE